MKLQGLANRTGNLPSQIMRLLLEQADVSDIGEVVLGYQGPVPHPGEADEDMRRVAPNEFDLGAQMRVVRFGWCGLITAPADPFGNKETLKQVKSWMSEGLGMLDRWFREAHGASLSYSDDIRWGEPTRLRSAAEWFGLTT